FHLADVLTYGKIDHALSDYLQTAFEHRPDLAELNDDARAAGAQITQYRSDYFPTTYAIANYSTMGTTTPAATNFDAGVVITWPIFNGMETSHQVAEAKYHQRAIEHTIKDLRQRVFLEVKSAYLDWQASLERIRRAEQTLAASAVELELAEKRYEAGLGDIIELTDAQQRYTDDDAQYVQALYSFSLSKAALERATGGSLSVVQ
ncbi:MAG TPA: TolC family protein, partial [Candidatus Binatus sp.]|nr:TolC family protein [Candidatus Binatus sp.]